MSLYHCTIAHDGDKRQVIVHWDDNDPNRHIVAPCTVPADTLDESSLARIISSMGFRIATDSSDNVERGWAIVARTNSDRPFYDPLDGDWRTFLTDEQKRKIRDKWPGAAVPGVR